MNARVWIVSLVLVSSSACGRPAAGGGGDGGGGGGGEGGTDSGSSLPDGTTLPVKGGMDPNPTIAFTQVAKAVGINRSNEPASAGTFDAMNTIAYGGWLADLDGDGRLDYYGVNHAQTPHLSGLFLNNGSGGFGKNLFTVSLLGSTVAPPTMSQSNEMKFVGDLTGDGLVDLYFTGWFGIGVLCVNQGVVHGSDWTGPSYLCFGTTDALDFADVNGDGKIDVLGLEVSNTGFDVYTAYYSHTASYVWRLNNGNPDINTWPTTQDFLALHPTQQYSPSPPFVDLDGDGVPDKIVGIVQPDVGTSRGVYGTLTAGKQVFLGQAGGSYVMKTKTGLEAVTEPIRFIEDVNDDGCLDIGTDVTGYRDNQNWYIQHRSAAGCDVTFSAMPRTALPYYPGSKRYSVDIDNSGLLSKVVLVHSGYGNNDGLPVGVSIYRKLPDGSYQAIPPDHNGIQITGTDTSEFYADNLSPGDFNDDGLLDLAGTGSVTMAGTDSGHGLWKSTLATTNGWIKLSLPTVTGFFTGVVTIEAFAPGAVGDASRRTAEPRKLSTGHVWASQVYHLGIGTWPSVDVRVTFADGRQVVRAGVARGERITIQ